MNNVAQLTIGLIAALNFSQNAIRCAKYTVVLDSMFVLLELACTGMQLYSCTAVLVYSYIKLYMSQLYSYWDTLRRTKQGPLGHKTYGKYKTTVQLCSSARSAVPTFQSS